MSDPSAAGRRSGVGRYWGQAGVILVLLMGGVGCGDRSQEPGDPPGDFPSAAEPGGRIRVEVLNAGGVAGLARRATDRLRAEGLDVVSYGNAEQFDLDSTVVYDRVGRPESARAVAEALGIRNVRTELDSSRYVDVTVMLGSEWGSSSRDGTGGRGSGRSWWDPRRWLDRDMPSAPADGQDPGW